MDDLKIYAKNADQVKLAQGITEKFTLEIGIHFGSDKYVKIDFNPERLAGISEVPELGDGRAIQHLGAGEI